MLQITNMLSRDRYSSSRFAAPAVMLRCDRGLMKFNAAPSASAGFLSGLMVAAFGILSCGSDSPTNSSPGATTTTLVTRASITVSVCMATGGDCPEGVQLLTAFPEQPHDAWEIGWTVTVRETASVGLTVTSIRSTVHDSATGAVAKNRANNVDAFALYCCTCTPCSGARPPTCPTCSVSPNISPLGRLSVTQGMKYTLPSGGRNAYLDVEVEGSDERGNRITGNARTNIVPR